MNENFVQPNDFSGAAEGCFAGKVVIVSGADSGLGAATAHPATTSSRTGDQAGA
jgi:hypothetical protein